MTQGIAGGTNKKALSAGIWYTVSNLLIRGVNLFTLPLFSRMLSVSEFGDFSTYTSVMTLMTIITTFELYTSVNRARFDFSENLNEYLSSIAVQSTVITGAFYILCVVFSDAAQAVFSLDMKTIHVMFIYMLTSPAIQILQARHRIEMRYIAFIIISLFTLLGNALLSVALIMVMEDRYMGRLIGSALPTIVFGAVIYGLLLYRGKTLYKKEYWKYALSISLPLIPHLVSTSVLSQFSRIMVRNMQGKEAAGRFSMVCNIALILLILWQSFNNAWQPWSMEKMNTGEHAQLRRASRSYLCLFYVLVGGLIAIAPEVLLFFGSGKYMDDATLYSIPLVLLGSAFQFSASLYVNTEIFQKKTTYASVATILAAAVNILLNLLLIPALGMLGAGLSMLIGYIIMHVLHFVFSRKLSKEQLYDERFMWAGLFALLLFSGLVALLYKNLILRYGVLAAALAAVAVFMWNDFKAVTRILLRKKEAPDGEYKKLKINSKG